MVIPIGVKVDQEGGISVPARVLSELVGELPAGEMSLTEENLHLMVAMGQFKADLAGVAVSEFPALPVFDKKKLLEFPTEVFLAALKRVVFAAATDEGRPALTGVNFSLKGSEPRMAATDGFRLSVVNLPPLRPDEGQDSAGQANKVEDKETLIIPARALAELIRLSGEGETGETISVSGGKEKQLRFAVGKAEILTRLIDGEYPDYERIMPKETVATFTGDKESLLRVVRLASIFARESANVVKLVVEKGQLKILAASSQLGTNEGYVEGKVEGEDGFTVAFNYRYILDFLGSCEGDEVRCEFSGPLSPGVFTDPKVREFKHVIMPVRV
jgi:DNA polymerase-3 subunit beta